ncbi:MAG: methyltransferase domain-containing protein [Rhodovibrionaceae bacterium]|nr:methyltransferase domain-containing protein [Rhodovibrionaceae bacterium]
MSEENGFQQHWLDIDPERMERYETMFQWTPASEAFYAPAKIGQDQVVADFGCGPGHAAVEFARRVGPSGHIHAMDINAEFIRRTREKAAQQGLSDRVSAHLLERDRLPLSDASLDRIVARNTLIYVPDPVATLAEFRRVLRPDGIAHAIEGDWSLTAVEPVPTEEWRALIAAASWAWPRPEIGRRLYGYARQAGFEDIEIQVLTWPDTEGRLSGMIQTVAEYAKESGKIEAARVDAMLETIQRAITEGAYLGLSPQFLVTARA